MSAELRIPLDIPDVEILKTEITKDNRVIIEIESTRETTECGICGQEIRCSYGHGQERMLRHLPVLGIHLSQITCSKKLYVIYSEIKQSNMQLRSYIVFINLKYLEHTFITKTVR